jgi:hypothetical protein
MVRDWLEKWNFDWLPGDTYAFTNEVLSTIRTLHTPHTTNYNRWQSSPTLYRVFDEARQNLPRWALAVVGIDLPVDRFRQSNVLLLKLVQIGN